MTAEGWGDWVIHDGMDVPGPLGTPVRIRWESGDVEATFIGENAAATAAAGRLVHGSWLWARFPNEGVERIVAYQFRRSIENEIDALREMVDAVFNGGVIVPELVPVPVAPDDPTWGYDFA